jgi:hypothetical protein
VNVNNIAPYGSGALETTTLYLPTISISGTNSVSISCTYITAS